MTVPIPHVDDANGKPWRVERFDSSWGGFRTEDTADNRFAAQAVAQVAARLASSRSRGDGRARRVVDTRNGEVVAVYRLGRRTTA